MTATTNDDSLAELHRATSEVAATTKRARQHIDIMRARIVTKGKELQTARHAPLPLGEIRERIAARVARDGADWLDRHGRSFVFGERGCGTPGIRHFRLPDVSAWGARCAADPEGSTDFLMAIVHRVDFEPGAPSADRPRVLANLESELAELEVAEEAAIDAAARSGVVIEHRPEVIKRRQNETRRRQLDEERAEDRAAREARLNMQHEEQRRTGRSEYLGG